MESNLASIIEKLELDAAIFDALKLHTLKELCGYLQNVYISKFIKRRLNISTEQSKNIIMFHKLTTSGKRKINSQEHSVTTKKCRY